MMDLEFLTSDEPYFFPAEDNVSLDSDRLRCMATFIASKNVMGSGELLEDWSCTLPRLGHGVCASESGNGIAKEAYIHCGGQALPPTHSPSPTPEMHLSMSFAYNDEYDWVEYDPGMVMSFSMSLGMFDDDEYWSSSRDSSDSSSHDGNKGEMEMYIDAVCGLISELNTDVATQCLKPVCEIGLDGIFIPTVVPSEDTAAPTPAMTSNPTTTQYQTFPTDTPTASPSESSTTNPPTPFPTMKPTVSPSAKPTPQPTRPPTPKPTAQTFGSVEVSFEIEFTLEGIDVSDIDITSLDKVVDLLETVFGDLLPPDAIVRLLTVGGISVSSVSRRLLRFLQDDGNSTTASSGVDVEFEVIMSQTCADEVCEASEIDSIESSLYADVTATIEQKVTSGELTASIQEEAVSNGVDQLASVSVSASSLQIGEAKVVVKEGSDNNMDDDDDDWSASSKHGMGLAVSILIGAVSSVVCSFI